MTTLSFEDLTVRFGSGRRGMTAVDGVSLTIPPGKVVGLVGESGSGKSTLGRAAIGFAPVTSGRVLIDNEPLQRATPRRRPRVQMVFQDPYASLDPRMSIGDSIAEKLPKAERRSRAGARAEVARLLTLVGIDVDRANMLPNTLSGGQRQRVALASALAARPDVIVADEITSALDVSVQGTVLNLVRSLQRDLDLSMLFVSHNLAVIRYVSDIVAVMYMGRIVEVGETEALLADPQHPYTRELLDAIPRLGGSLLDLAEVDPLLQTVADAEPSDPHDPPAGCRFHARCPIGPFVHADRQQCIDVDPQREAATRRHATACHFAAKV